MGSNIIEKNIYIRIHSFTPSKLCLTTALKINQHNYESV